MVLLESLAGTGHKITRIKPKGSEKLEMLFTDPFGEKLYSSMLQLFIYGHYVVEQLKIIKTKYACNFQVSMRLNRD